MTGAAEALGALTTFAATPAGQKLLGQLAEAWRNGWHFELHVARPEPFDPVAEAFAEELPPPTLRDPDALNNDGKETP